MRFVGRSHRRIGGRQIPDRCRHAQPPHRRLGRWPPLGRWSETGRPRCRRRSSSPPARKHDIASLHCSLSLLYPGFAVTVGQSSKPTRPSAAARSSGVQSSGTSAITWHGLPTAMESAGMSWVTTAPAPIIELSPMVTPGQITTLPPSHTLLPMVTSALCCQPSSRGLRAMAWFGV